MTPSCFAGSATCDDEVQKFKFYGNAVDQTGRPADDLLVFRGHDSKWQFSLCYSGFDAYLCPLYKIGSGFHCVCNL